MTLIELAERVEAAAGEDRRLDAIIAKLVGFWPKGLRRDIDYEWVRWIPNKPLDEPIEAPAYTASIDAAMTLVPEGNDWIIGHTNGGLTIHAEVGGRGDEYMRFAATPALALCAAALRARDTYAKRQDRNGLGPKDSGPVPERDAPAPCGKGGIHDPHP